MQKNNNITSRIARYSKVSACFMLLAGQAEADVIYTDVPDVLLVNDQFPIDLDGDGETDIGIWQAFYSGTAPYVGVFDYGNKVVGTGSAFYTVYALSAGLSVGAAGTVVSNLVWTTTNGIPPHFYNYYMNLEAYVGFEFEAASGAIHNGWVRVYIHDNTAIEVWDYAYEDVPGVPIITGDMGPACDASVAPANFSANIDASSVTFNWDPVPGSVGCQLKVGELGAGFPVKRNFIGAGIVSSGPIPLPSLPSGNYQAKVRCACEITPVIDATPFSNVDFFTVPVPRLSPPSDLEFGPNPTAIQLTLTYDAVIDEEVNFRIYNMLGQEMFTQTAMMFQGRQQVSFDVSDFESGLYLLMIEKEEGTIAEQFEVVR